MSVERIVVLMLETRAFDHIVSFSAITGRDTQTGAPTQVNALDGKRIECFQWRDPRSLGKVQTMSCRSTPGTSSRMFWSGLRPGCQLSAK